jgi:hypothetical protein
MIVTQKSTGLLDRQRPPETRDKVAASGPGEVEPGEPTRPLYDDHLSRTVSLHPRVFLPSLRARHDAALRRNKFRLDPLE